eukprot:CAMPEP_0177662394 /NCGR_PEP_ID=MMETSP0447-20121125/19265_1 /TAXON_ID=0 /ORGANISM="Stygamoeba regulata, Strain BSH-02190019" /LENGTH=646 /DNA_ID=CAMNT_0019167953 /DNA_START=80 /DNA_END=2020 /DNA_ORIENTATION=+
MVSKVFAIILLCWCVAEVNSISWELGAPVNILENGAPADLRSLFLFDGRLVGCRGNSREIIEFIPEADISSVLIDNSGPSKIGYPAACFHHEEYIWWSSLSGGLYKLNMMTKETGIVNLLFPALVHSLQICADEGVLVGVSNHHNGTVYRVDPVSGEYFVLKRGIGKVGAIACAGKVVYMPLLRSGVLMAMDLTTLHTTHHTFASLVNPIAVTLDSFGDIYLLDAGSTSLVKASLEDGTVTPVVSPLPVCTTSVALETTERIFFSTCEGRLFVHSEGVLSAMNFPLPQIPLITSLAISESQAEPQVLLATPHGVYSAPLSARESIEGLAGALSPLPATHNIPFPITTVVAGRQRGYVLSSVSDVIVLTDPSFSTITGLICLSRHAQHGLMDALELVNGKVVLARLHSSDVVLMTIKDAVAGEAGGECGGLPFPTSIPRLAFETEDLLRVLMPVSLALSQWAPHLIYVTDFDTGYVVEVDVRFSIPRIVGENVIEPRGVCAIGFKTTSRRGFDILLVESSGLHQLLVLPPTSGLPQPTTTTGPEPDDMVVSIPVSSSLGQVREVHHRVPLAPNLHHMPPFEDPFVVAKPVYVPHYDEVWVVGEADGTVKALPIPFLTDLLGPRQPDPPAAGTTASDTITVNAGPEIL